MQNVLLVMVVEPKEERQQKNVQYVMELVK